MTTGRWKQFVTAIKRWTLHSYRTKLTIAFMGVAFAVLLLMGGVYYYRMYDGIEQNTRQNLGKLAERTVSTIELYMESIDNEAWNIFSDKDFQIFVENMNNGFPEKTSYYRNRFEMLLRKNELIGLLAVYDLQGNRLHGGMLAVRGTSAEAVKREEEKLIAHGLQNEGKADWLIARLDPEGSAYTLSYVQAIKKINTYSQKIVGVLRVDLAAGAFTQMLRDLDPAGTNDFYIVDDSGSIIQSSDQRQIGNVIQDLPWYRPGEYTAEAGIAKAVVAGKSQMTVYRHFDKQDWMLIGSFPMDNIMAEAQQAKNFMLWVGLLCLATAALFAYVLSGSVTRSLRELRERMKQVEMGNFKISVPVKSMDEIGIIGVRFNRMVSEIDHLIDQIYKVELLRKDAEIQALQLQINPHFLYNALEMIDSVASIEGQELISRVAHSLASMFRYSISGAKFSTLQEEVEQVRLYLQIQQFRYEDRFSYTIEIDPSLTNTMLPKLILQPLVENAIKHGIEQQLSGGRLSIQVSAYDEDRMQIRVWDNGTALGDQRLQEIRQLLQDAVPSRSPDGRISIGLDNVNRRLRLHYGERAELIFDSAENGAGTEVCLIVPLAIEAKGESA